MPGIWLPDPSWQDDRLLQVGSPRTSGVGKFPKGSGICWCPGVVGTLSFDHDPVAPPVTSSPYGTCTVNRLALFCEFVAASAAVEFTRMPPPFRCTSPLGLVLNAPVVLPRSSDMIASPLFTFSAPATPRARTGLKAASAGTSD